MGQIVMGKKPHIASVLPDNPVVNAIGDVVHKMMESDSEKRISVEEIRKKLEDILLEYPEGFMAEPEYPRPPLKTPEEISQWCEKFQYARKMHNVMLPQLKKLLTELESRPASISNEEQKEDQREILKNVTIPPSSDAGLKFRCPGCNRKLQIQSNRVGKPFRCPNCQQYLLVKTENELSL
jgi:predicted RNA-binding Zn-ribbon protein involved in translation (DUF1610 family)